MTDPTTPAARLICDCCHRKVTSVWRSMWHGTARICAACFAVWYDRGIVDPTAIKAEVLRAEAAGTFPFPITEPPQ